MHTTVLLHEAVTALVTDTRGAYIDGTFGRGGHSAMILQALAPEGRLLALDRDPEAVAAAATFAPGDPRFEIVRSRFGRLGDLVALRGLTGRISGVLLDLGVSSPQLDSAPRGFSFRQDGPLDMRMDPAEGESAAQWLADADEAEIAEVLWRLGEERFARRIARAIVEQRVERPITTTAQLAGLIAANVRTREPGKHPATRSFQAIRIFVNRELDELRSVLPQVLEVLATGGRLVVISFHSLEDRIVKRFMQAEARGQQPPKSVPVRDDQIVRRLKLIGRAERPSAAEIDANPRARSAVMRVAEKLA